MIFITHHRTGFLALCTSNLPAVAVVPSKNFNPVIYTGDGSAQDITTVGFQPDFTWIKNRSANDSHQLFDAVRGVTNAIHSDTTAVEGANDDTLTHFLSNGFTTGDDVVTNTNNENYVAWNWKANGSGSTNTAGSVDSTVSVNTNSGFSIVGYTATANTHTFGHGLSQAPEFIYHRMRDVAGGGNCWLAPLGSGKSLRMDETTATGSEAGYWPIVNATLVKPGSSVSGAIETDYIAYCFHSVDGYSKVGTYTGNANADGAFIYTGFKPAFVITKLTSTTSAWNINDNKRDPSNVVNLTFKANTSDAENSTMFSCDFTSNGFKMRDGGNNNAAQTGIYIAFAETPFKYSNAR